MVKHLGLRAGNNGFVEGITGRLDVVFQLFTCHLEGAAVVAKSVWRHRVLGDILNVVDVEPQQVPHGVLVLITSESAKDHLAAFALVDFVGVFNGGIEPVQNNFEFFGCEVFFVIGRHFPKVDDAAYIMPGFGISHIVDHVNGECVETDFTLLLLFTMTTEAFLLENGPYMLGVSFWCSRRSRFGKQLAAKHEEHWQIFKAGQFP